jgi:hypothetical protein
MMERESVPEALKILAQQHWDGLCSHSVERGDYPPCRKWRCERCTDLMLADAFAAGRASVEKRRCFSFYTVGCHRMLCTKERGHSGDHGLDADEAAAIDWWAALLDGARRTGAEKKLSAHDLRNMAEAVRDAFGPAGQRSAGAAPAAVVDVEGARLFDAFEGTLMNLHVEGALRNVLGRELLLSLRLYLQSRAQHPQPAVREDGTSHDTAECCRELTRVWEALGNPPYNGQSASERVRELARAVVELGHANFARDHEAWGKAVESVNRLASRLSRSREAANSERSEPRLAPPKAEQPREGT